MKILFISVLQCYLHNLIICVFIIFLDYMLYIRYFSMLQQHYLTTSINSQITVTLNHIVSHIFLDYITWWHHFIFLYYGNIFRFMYSLFFCIHYCTIWQHCIYYHGLTFSISLQVFWDFITYMSSHQLLKYLFPFHFIHSVYVILVFYFSLFYQTSVKKKFWNPHHILLILFISYICNDISKMEWMLYL